MSARKTSQKQTPTTAPPGNDPVVRKKRRQQDGARETVESIAIAFVLAFLFKTFQAEAYVIPTGSMAPTLYGRHKEVCCEACGFEFAVGASTEIDQSTGLLVARIENAVCVNCGFRNAAMNAPVYNGDRILVNKQIDHFRRFDVVVFKNPEEAHINYIKRLVGLPGERIRVRKGDIWAKTADGNAFQIQRKADPNVQNAIQLMVHDDRHPARPLLQMGWPERWEPCEEGSGSDSVGGWIPSEAVGIAPDRDARTYAFESQGDALQWLRYRHMQPTDPVWWAVQNEQPLPRPEARLISDFCSFNAYDVKVPKGGQMSFEGGIYWVGDLTVQFQLDVTASSETSVCVVELIEGPDTYQCEINLDTGQATLWSCPTPAEVGEQVTRSEVAIGQTQIAGAGTYDLCMANVDDRVCLWVDGTLVEFDRSTEFECSDVPAPTDRDLCPVGIALGGATGRVAELIVKRDIYYRNDVIDFKKDDRGYRQGQLRPVEEISEFNRATLQQNLNSPANWSEIYNHESAENNYRYGQFGEYQLADDEYLMFGDNSSMSKDSRLFDYFSRPLHGVFSNRYAVREKDLIGKALFIFWPHGVPFLRNGQGFPVWAHKGLEEMDPKNYPSVRAPFYPNIQRMKKIR